MGEDLHIWRVTASQINTYYAFVSISFIPVFYKYSKKPFSLYLTLIFYSGLISYFSQSLFNFYKITITLITIFWLIKTKALQINRGNNSVIYSFIFFSFTFFLTALLTHDYFAIIFSQYSRYFIVLSFFLILAKYHEGNLFRKNLEKVIFELLFVQILLSVVKLFIMGPRESLVGSISSQGGAVATSLPILGFVFFWLKKKGVLKRKEWAFIFGLLLIGFVGDKRAIWFIMPIVISLIIFYVPKRSLSPKLAILSLIIVPLVFYLGVRLTSTLNKEGKIWGSFDLAYVLEYAENYSFGNKGFTGSGIGRGGTTLLVYENLINNRFDSKDIYGRGLRFMFSTTYEEFKNLGLEINHKGYATGVYQTLISNGYIGILGFLIFAFSILWRTKNKRLRIVLIALFSWEYFFYTGILFREPALGLLLIYIVTFSESDITNLSKSYISIKAV